jgi:ribonucleotide reductase beta subunit family protein with ferritin-like domain
VAGASKLQHASFTECLITFAVVEGIFFPGSFCGCHLFGLSNVVYSLACFANELISCDEALHCDFACVLYNHLLKPPCSIHVREIVESAIQVEECFICKANLMGMNATLIMKQPIHLILC